MKNTNPFLLGALAFCLATAPFATAQSNANRNRNRAAKPKPTFADVRYGSYERNILDFWQSKSDKPTPLAIYIHGGGFRSGSKDSINDKTLKELLDAGISVAAIHYRLLAQAKLPAALHHSRRALQFLRSKSDGWNIDKSLVGAFGGSAGAQICMWLAFHDDMATPGSKDPIERESTRLTAVSTSGGQTTMNLNWWQENIPGYNRPHRPRAEYFGDLSEAELLKRISKLAALDLISADDPPIHMSYGMKPDAPIPSDPKRANGWKVHHVNFGLKLKAKMDALNIEADLKHPGAKTTYKSVSDFFIRKLNSTE